MQPMCSKQVKTQQITYQIEDSRLRQFSTIASQQK